uniref:Uncharacterized protein n=1 Tax=Palpitomonas bilix TaxID=652834 RepID=A0A7S3LUB8_9EUKA|mmetsp:Transcript_46797/g.120601  ORF Transcript_46797/g.120601 Transcript_46797/m.120601 type:complete len:423 (+) Transcript_46797:72-1340(+)
MLTAAAGFKSASLDVQKRVETSISALIPALPSMLEKCKHNQNVLRTMKMDDIGVAKDGGEGAGTDVAKSKEYKAGMRAKAISTLISNPSNSFSANIFESIRAELNAELSKLRVELQKVEENVKKATKKEREEVSSAAYLLAMQQMSVEKAKVATPYLLSMSDKLEIDLLELDDSHLATVLEVKEVKDVKGVAGAALKALEQCRKKIESGGEESVSLCTTSSLSSFLSGSTVKGMTEDPSIVETAFALSKTPTCESSRWRRKFGKAWSWLENTQAEWTKLEGKVKATLAKRATAADVADMGSLVDELEASTLVTDKMEDDLVEAIDRVLGVSDRRRYKSKEGMPASPPRMQEELCGECRQRAAALRCMPCKHKSICEACLAQLLPLQEDMENLRKVGIHMIKPGDSPITCPTCYETAMFINTL